MLEIEPIEVENLQHSVRHLAQRWPRVRACAKLRASTAKRRTHALLVAQHTLDKTRCTHDAVAPAMPVSELATDAGGLARISNARPRSTRVSISGTSSAWSVGVAARSSAASRHLICTGGPLFLLEVHYA
jgi:hypothetical protein